MRPQNKGTKPCQDQGSHLRNAYSIQTWSVPAVGQVGSGVGGEHSRPSPVCLEPPGHADCRQRGLSGRSNTDREWGERSCSNGCPPSPGEILELDPKGNRE